MTDSEGFLDYSYSYDDLYQLIAESGNEHHQYQNDSLYNRISKNEESYSLNDLNQLISHGDSQYHYDANGNLIEKTRSDTTTQYRYDALDRLVEVKKGEELFSYCYDSFHRRVSKTVDGMRTEFLYQGQNEIGAFVDGKLTQLRVLGLSRGAEIGAAIAYELNGITYAPVHDPYGSVVTLVDSTGASAETYRYTAFGEMQTYSNGISLDNPWKFSSKRFDPETGFLYFGRRYYVPEIGRWITPDPAGFDDGPNLYAYV